MDLEPHAPFNQPSSAQSRRPEKLRRVTIKDVAKIAGVHFTTVSLALRHHPSIPESTRERVLQAALRIGYSPDPVFAALTHFHVNGAVRATAPKIAFLVNRSYASGTLFHAQQRALFTGAQQQARTLGYDLEYIDVNEAPEPGPTVDILLRAQHISGLIIANFEPGLASLALDWELYSTVKINSMHMAPETTLVSNDHLQDVRLACKRLTALGYTRIGLAIGRSDDEATQNRLTAGYFVEQTGVSAEHRLSPLYFPLHSPEEEAAKALGSWIRSNRIEAVISSRPNIDELLTAASLPVPDAVACAALSVVDPKSQLAGVRPNLGMVGLKAVSLLDTQLKFGERGVPAFASTTYVQSVWQDGPTAPPKD